MAYSRMLGVGLTLAMLAVKAEAVAAQQRTAAPPQVAVLPSYLYSGAEAEGVCRLAAAAAPRIAAVIREAEGAAN